MMDPCSDSDTSINDDRGQSGLLDSLSIREQQTGKSRHQMDGNQVKQKSSKEYVKISEAERLKINAEVDNLIKNAEKKFLEKVKNELEHGRGNKPTPPLFPQSLDKVTEEEIFFESGTSYSDVSLPNQEALSFNKTCELRHEPTMYTQARTSKQVLLKLESPCDTTSYETSYDTSYDTTSYDTKSYEGMQCESRTTVSDSNGYPTSHDDSSHESSEGLSIHLNTTKKSESWDCATSKPNLVNSKTYTLGYESQDTAGSQDQINSETYTIEFESSDTSINRRNTAKSKLYSNDHGTQVSTDHQFSSVNNRTLSVCSQDYNASSEMSSFDERSNVAFLEKKSLKQKKIYGSTYTIKSQICSTCDEQPEITEHGNCSSSPREVSKSDAIVSEERVSDVTLKNVDFDLLLWNSKYRSQSCSNLTQTCPKTTPNSVGRSSIKKDNSSEVSKTVSHKFWKSWSASKCACTHQTQSEERRKCQAKIQDFIKLLRHHKEESDGSGKTCGSGYQRDRYSDFDRNKSYQLGDTQTLSETSKTNENEMVSVDPIRNKKSQHVFGHSFISGADHENISKCSVLKQTTSLCHRYKAQKQIIAEQKKQIEAQKRMIESIKLENLNKDAKISATQAVDHVKHVSRGVTTVHDDTKKVQFLSTLPSTMQQRENWKHMMRERKEHRHKERMLKKEWELQNQKQAEDDQRKQIEEEIKKKRWLRIQAEKKKQLAKSRMEETINRANNQYKNSLLRNGLNAFKTIVALEKERIQFMTEYYNKRILMKHFYMWLNFVTDFSQERKLLATSWYNKNILQKAFSTFLEVYQDLVRKEQVAEDYSNMRMVKQAFKKLQVHAYKQRILNKNLKEQSEHIYKRKLLKRAWEAWRSLPDVLEEERKKEHRKEFWRQTVRDVVPDFSPATEDSN